MDRKVLCNCREQACCSFVENINAYCESYGLALTDELIYCCNSVLVSTNKIILEDLDCDE